MNRKIAFCKSAEYLHIFPQLRKNLTGRTKHLTRTPAAPIIEPGIGFGCRFDAKRM